MVDCRPKKSDGFRIAASSRFSPDRDQNRDVKELASRFVRVVCNQNVTRLESLRGDLGEHVRRPNCQRVDVARRSGNGLGDHPAPPIKDCIGKVTSLPHDRAEGRPLEGPGLLVDRGNQRLPQDLQIDWVETGHWLSLMATRLPSSATSIDQPGRITEVVSRSSTITGPSRRIPVGSSSRR